MSARLVTSPRSRWMPGSLTRLLVALPLLVLLLAGQFAAGAHHHAADDSRGACSLCVLAHAPAVETAAVPIATAPQTLRERPYLAPSWARAEFSLPHPTSRAPPRG